jgi:predicted PurR-regulated permease PerM
VVSWIILILLVSYFLLAESEGIQSQLLNINIPGYANDLNHINTELKRIWSGFMRGQILVVFISFLIYLVVLGVLGVQFFLGLSLIAAVGQMIPYVGAWATWISFGLVSLFQPNIPFGLVPGIYMVIVLAVAMLFNNIIDNIIRTRVMAENLKVHPAVVLIGALIGVQLFGFIGIIVAAPVMASLQLFLSYIIKKLSDLDPWEELTITEPVEKRKWLSFLQKPWSKFTDWVAKTWQKLWKRENQRNAQGDDSD